MQRLASISHTDEMAAQGINTRNQNISGHIDMFFQSRSVQGLIKATDDELL